MPGSSASAVAPVLTATPHANDLAYAFNVTVTVTGTVGKGWLALYPGDATFSGTSSMNWFGNEQDLANHAYTGIESSNAGVHIRCGGGGTRTHFILDLIAILVLVDLSSVVTAQRSPLDVASLASTPRERAQHVG